MGTPIYRKSYNFGNDRDYVKKEFEIVSINLTLQQWREIRNDFYWKGDKLKTQDEKLTHKIKCINYWKKNKKPLEYEIFD